jgi:hypothetical protein
MYLSITRILALLKEFRRDFGEDYELAWVILRVTKTLGIKKTITKDGSRR